MMPRPLRLNAGRPDLLARPMHRAMRIVAAQLVSVRQLARTMAWPQWIAGWLGSVPPGAGQQPADRLRQHRQQPLWLSARHLLARGWLVQRWLAKVLLPNSPAEGRRFGGPQLERKLPEPMRLPATAQLLGCLVPVWRPEPAEAPVQPEPMHRRAPRSG